LLPAHLNSRLHLLLVVLVLKLTILVELMVEVVLPALHSMNHLIQPVVMLPD
jgi:hypothetical protein